MPMQSDQYLPTNEEFESFTTSSIIPIILDLEKELSITLNPNFFVVVGKIEECYGSTEDHNAICKLAYYRTFAESRAVVYAAFRLNKKDTSTGFYGFDIKGDIKNGIPRLKSKTMIYNDSHFPKW